MSCNVSDPKISEAYSRILSYDDLDWMIIGYGASRDTLLLYSSGNKGVAQMSASVPDEVVFGYIMFEGSGVLVTHVSHKIR
ncbi:hypothetical protein IWW57_000986 [Coemansia sp. S610]|nr:hypothetical protein LPJ60_003633 [Coemansia sp. RSA 2675]KAJ2030853.1 hypothetical protein IWW57_000986 [Coemansia sp. S610]KAJ2414463.1 hypothetical protein GGI10_002363 [Coemansia sp. RSA 2530]